MHPLYTDDEFKAAKSRDKLPLKCKHCQISFLRPKHEIQKVVAGTSKRTLDFCVYKCKKNDQTLLVDILCSQCGTILQKQPKDIRQSKSGCVFCNRSCAAKWNNAHKKHGTRRSKLEVWLEEQLTALYPDLEIHFNRKDAILSELDIFIPSLMLAFELNGIFHYEPIYGQGKLDAMRSNDHRKFAACHEAGISLCSIDTSHQKYFKPKSSQKFLGIIQDIISNRLLGS